MAGWLVAIGTIAGVPAAKASGPDLPARTPIYQSPAATATASVSRGDLCASLRRRLRQGGRAGGVFVLEASARPGRVTCRTAARTPRKLASNMKLFTTATALARFGSEHRIPTTLWRVGRVDAKGILHGDLYLVGGGDPTLATPAFASRHLGTVQTNLYALAGQARAAGIKRVTGHLLADDTLFDRLRGVADSGYATSPYIGPLSALELNLGYADSDASHFASDPARVAARKLARYLSRHGVAISRRVGVRALPRARRPTVVGTVRSPRLARIVNATGVYSVNIYAELLAKGLGAHFRASGSTAAGISVIERFARTHNSAVQGVDGSGLTDSNRASPAAVGRLLQAMLHTAVRNQFVGALPVAGREGTVDDRMRGTAAEGRCRTKTGTIYGVSALSGYCFNGTGKTMVFSILMNGVRDLYEARRQQDRMAALIARY